MQILVSSEFSYYTSTELNQDEHIPTKYPYPIFAIAVAPGVTNVTQLTKYVVVAIATPLERMFVGRISAL